MDKEKFEKSYEDLFWIYTNIFCETVKNRALEVGLSDVQWRELCEDDLIWNDYTNFFYDLFCELNRRKENGYFYVDDLLSPDTKDLEFQITEEIIKHAFVQHILLSHYDFSKIVNHIATLDLYDFLEKFKNNELGEFIKTLFPIKDIRAEIPFEYSDEDFKGVYDVFFRQPLYPNKSMEVSLAISSYSIGCVCHFNSLYEKNPQDKDAIFDYLRYLSDFFYENTSDIISTLSDEGGELKSFEIALLEMLFKYKEEIVNDKDLSHLYCGYILEKIKFLKGWHIDLLGFGGVIGKMNQYEGNGLKIGKLLSEGINESYINIGDGDSFYQIYISKDKLEEIISYFKDNEQVYDLLKIYYMLYGDILKREDSEQFIKELLHRLKRISEKDENIVLGLKEYLMYLFCNVFIDGNGGNKPKYFDSISEDIKDVFGEEDYKKAELLFSDNLFSKGDKNIREKYKIGLIFGDPTSKKAFGLYSNDKKNEQDFISRQLSRKQFDILAEEYNEQQDLDIEGKLARGDLTFVLVFETDHETKLRNLMKIYPNRIIVCNIPGQHFSHEQFRKMLDLGLRNVEGN